MKVDSLLLGSKELGTRFALVAQLPTLVFVLLVLALAWSGAPGDSPELDRVVDKLNGLGATDAVLLVVGVLAASLLLQPFQFPLVRLLEGYWGSSGLAVLVAKPLHERQLKRRKALVAGTQLRAANATRSEVERMGAAAWRLRLRYPAADRVLPTALGNGLRAAEDRAGDRYGIDTVVVWPRLYPLLSETLRAILDDQRLQLDLAVRFSTTFLVGAWVSIGFLAQQGWWLLVPLVLLLLAWLSYQGAVAAAVAYGQTIEAAFDLHRFDLLEALHLPLPSTSEEERSANERLSNRLRQDIEVDVVRYRHAESDAASGGSGEKEPLIAARARRR